MGILLFFVGCSIGDKYRDIQGLPIPSEWDGVYYREAYNNNDNGRIEVKKSEIWQDGFTSPGRPIKFIRFYENPSSTRMRGWASQGLENDRFNEGYFIQTLAFYKMNKEGIYRIMSGSYEGYDKWEVGLSETYITEAALAKINVDPKWQGVYSAADGTRHIITKNMITFKFPDLPVKNPTPIMYIHESTETDFRISTGERILHFQKDASGNYGYKINSHVKGDAIMDETYFWFIGGGGFKPMVKE